MKNRSIYAMCEKYELRFNRRKKNARSVNNFRIVTDAATIVPLRPYLRIVAKKNTSNLRSIVFFYSLFHLAYVRVYFLSLYIILYPRTTYSMLFIHREMIARNPIRVLQKAK